MTGRTHLTSPGIRAARRADLRAVEAIVRDAYAPWTSRIGREPGPLSDDYEGLIADGRVSVVERDGIVQGVLVLVPRGDTLLLNNVAVAPAAQGTGLGREMLAFAETAARAAGCRELRLHTNEAMAENIRLYLRLGYAETHRAEEMGLRRVHMVKAVPPAPDAGRDDDG